MQRRIHPPLSWVLLIAMLAVTACSPQLLTPVTPTPDPAATPGNVPVATLPHPPATSQSSGDWIAFEVPEHSPFDCKTIKPVDDQAVKITGLA